MIVESSGVVLNPRYPWLDAPGGVPVAWYVGNAADIAPGGIVAQEVAAAWSTIPSAILTPFTTADPVSVPDYTGTLRMYLDKNGGEMLRSQLQLPSSAGGQYFFEGNKSSSILAMLPPTATFWKHTIRHEFGHHIDQTYHRIWPTGNGTRDNLAGFEPFASLWTAAYPTIPTGEYGHTSPLEWIAELWMCQTSNPADIDQAGESMATKFLHLAGDNQTIADAIRTAFTDKLPMPAWNGYP